ncbi:MAG: hypothetical protein ACERKV_02180 [Clostridiaceae bacterium]
MKKIISIFVMTMIITCLMGISVFAENTNLIVKQVKTSPEIITPGENFKVNFNLENKSNGTISDITIKFVGIEGTASLTGFSPLNTTNEINLDKIEKNSDKEVSIDMLADPSLKSGTYNIIIDLVYNNKYGNIIEENKTIGFVVSKKANLIISKLSQNGEDNDEDSKLYVGFINAGQATLNDVLLKVTVNDEEYINYYGMLESGDDDFYEMELPQDESINGKIEITYSDELNRENNISKDFENQVEESAKEEVKEEKSGFFSSIGKFFKTIFGLGN